MTKQKSNLPSAWQNGDRVQVVFPGNGKLQGKIIRVSFPEYGQTRYDVEVPFEQDGDNNAIPEYADRGDATREPVRTGYFRIHNVAEWFLSYLQEDWDRMQVEEKAPPSMLDAFGKAIGMIHEKSKD